jgi:hypothetical protein
MWNQWNGIKWGSLWIAMALLGSGCGGWIRSRLPDPNAGGVSAKEEAQAQPQGASAPAPVIESAVQPRSESTPETFDWRAPPEPARALVWGLWRSSSQDGTVPAVDQRVTEFLDGATWSTLDSGSESQAQGIFPGGWSDLEDPIHWRSESGTRAPLFVVLEGSFAGLPVIGTLYESEVRDGMNRPILKRERKLGRLDPASGRWFVPVSEILGERALQWVTPHHQFTLHWELELAHHQRVSVSTSFQIRLPPPKLVRSSQQGFRSGAGTLFQDSSIQNRVLHTEVWQNPSQREIDLWISARSAGVGETHGIVKKEPKLKSRYSDEVKWVESHLESAALFSLGAVEVEGGQVLQGSGASSEGSWIRIRLSPGESTRLKWMGAVQRSDFPSGCELNRKKGVTLVWYTRDFGPRRCDNGCDVPQESTRYIHWSQTRLAVSGQVQSKGFVSEPLVGDLSDELQGAGTDANRLSLLASHELASSLPDGGWSRPEFGPLRLPAWACNEGVPEN